MNEAVNALRIDFRWQAIDLENREAALAGEVGRKYIPAIFEHGDTRRQLPACSRHIVMKHFSRWTPDQRKRAEILLTSMFFRFSKIIIPDYKPFIVRFFKSCFVVDEHLKVSDLLFVIRLPLYLCVMFVRIRERGNGKVTISLVENIRESGKVRQKTLRNEAAVPQNELERFREPAEHIRAEMEVSAMPNLFSTRTLAEMVCHNRQHSIQDETP
jgi:hypothetical protein